MTEGIELMEVFVSRSPFPQKKKWNFLKGNKLRLFNSDYPNFG